MAGQRRVDPGYRGEVASRAAERRLATLASNRHRVVTFSELLGFGFSRQQIERRSAAGRLVRRYRGVYVVGPGALTDQGEWLAAALFADGVVSHADAALLSRTAVGTRRSPIHVTSSRRVAAPRGIKTHHAQLAADERTILHGVPTTTTGRTLLDCAASGASQRELERMLNEAWVLNLPVRPSLTEMLARYPGHRGIAALRGAANAFHGPSSRTRSDLEEDYLGFLDRHGFDRPLVNHRIETRLGPLVVDCAWPARRLVVELDAPSTHGSRSAMLRDRRRDRALRRAGWITVRLMDEDLDDQEALAAEMSNLLYP